MNRTELAPGVFLTDIPGEKFKRCKISVHLVLPGRRQDATALAVLPHILERRCAAIPDPIQLSRRLFSLYGAELSSESSAVGENRVVLMGISGLKSEYALHGEDLESEYLALLCQLLFAPKLNDGVFVAEDVEIEKTKQADYLRSEMNEKRSYCLRQARRKLFGDTTLGIESAGYLEDIDALTPADIYAAYTDLLSRAQVEIMVCGVSKEKVAAGLLAQLGAIARAPVAFLPPAAAPQAQQFQHFSEEIDTVQGKLAILCTSGQQTDARGAAVMRMASAAYGGLPTSRLFMNVREKQSLCYYCASGYGAFSGVLTIDSGVDHDMAQRAGEAILQELRTVQQDLISEEELENARLALQTGYAAAKDSPDALVSFALNERLRMTDLSIDEAAALIDSVTREDIRAAMRSFSPAVQYLIRGKEGA